MNNKFVCPVCGYLTFSEKSGSYQICEICFWEDDISQLKFPKTKGANHVSLIQAQQNFISFGVSEERFKSQVMHSNEYEKDPKWRPIDPAKDNIEEAVPNKEYGNSYPDDLTELYYWNK